MCTCARRRRTWLPALCRPGDLPSSRHSTGIEPEDHEDREAEQRRVVGREQYADGECQLQHIDKDARDRHHDVARSDWGATRPVADADDFREQLACDHEAEYGHSCPERSKDTDFTRKAAHGYEECIQQLCKRASRERVPVRLRPLIGLLDVRDRQRHEQQPDEGSRGAGTGEKEVRIRVEHVQFTEPGGFIRRGRRPRGLEVHRDVLAARAGRYLNQMRWYERLSGCSSRPTSAPSNSSVMITGKLITSEPNTTTSITSCRMAAATATA